MNNVGMLDRAARGAAGLALLAWALGVLPGVSPSLWGWTGLVPLGTALVGHCPIYAILGINTCRKD
ncbi:MAG: hypothetical protein CTY20_13275 [Hyphomicrobium sp.]|nr:MAG: hypothetical protein CTY20_13275 [Hyphomicrobium sp.]